MDANRRVRVVLDHLPAATFDEAVAYLRDVWRECQLVVVTADAGGEGALGADLVSVARGIVPDLEEVGDAFDAASVEVADGRACLAAEVAVGQAGTFAHLQSQLAQVRLIARTGGLLAAAPAAVHELLDWMWEETTEQLHGRAPRPSLRP